MLCWLNIKVKIINKYIDKKDKQKRGIVERRWQTKQNLQLNNVYQKWKQDWPKDTKNTS